MVTFAFNQERALVGAFSIIEKTSNFAKVCLQPCLQHLRHPRPRHRGCLVVSDLHTIAVMLHSLALDTGTHGFYLLGHPLPLPPSHWVDTKEFPTIW